MPRGKAYLEDRRGFTIIEMLTTAALFIIICGILFAAFSAASSVGALNSDFIVLQQEARRAVDGMGVEIRQNPVNNPVTISNGCSKISFSESGEVVSYYLNGNNQIVREYSLGLTHIIANKISALCFSVSGQTVLISLTASVNSWGRDLSFSLTDKVTMRN